jgi:hypothetical protein
MCATALEVGAAHEGVLAETVVPGEAPGDEEQPLPPVVVGHVEPPKPADFPGPNADIP